jgi:hypothetical protein
LATSASRFPLASDGHGLATAKLPVVEIERAALKIPTVTVLLGDFPYYYGPTDADPDPGKKWHIGCGGEVLFIDDGLICSECGDQADLDEPSAPQ